MHCRAQVHSLFAFQTQNRHRRQRGSAPPPQMLSSAQGCAWSWSCSWQRPPGLEELLAQSTTSKSQAAGCIPDPQLATSPGSQAASEHPPGSLLTILQGPLDVTCALTHCMKVSIQSGYEKQRFWDSHSTAFEALRTETLSLESRARLGDEPPWPGPSWAAQQAPPPPSTLQKQMVGKSPKVPSRPQ